MKNIQNIQSVISQSLVVTLSRKDKVACSTLQEASDLCRKYIDANQIGGSKWTAGKVYHPTLGFTHSVSYNGRVWVGGYKMKGGNVEVTGADLLKTIV